jgi:hypothetical protein
MQPFLDIFTDLQAARAAEFLARHGLHMKAGEGFGAALLKLLKPAWTTDDPEQLVNSNGIFFGIWVDAGCLAENRLRYNLHAKKLRLLKGEPFAAREFVRSFRAAAKGALADWPSATYPKGPITLFEGHVPLAVGTLKADASALLDRFARLAPLVDEALAKTK